MSKAKEKADAGAEIAETGGGKIELDTKEREQLIKIFQGADTKVLRAAAEAITMLVRAFNGLPPEPTDVISKLIDVNNKMERSRFPTYPILQKQVYLRLCAALIPEAKSSMETWADCDASALIEYKGEGRTEFVEATKAAANQNESSIIIGGGAGVEVDKKGILHRGRNVDKNRKRESEFEAERE